MSTSMTTAPAVKEIADARDFQASVLDRSRELPVVVDFWATWCGPCRVLGPVLEKEIAAFGGRVELAKVDTDANPDLAAQFGVQGIPSVKAFSGGRVVAEFVGARPAPFVRSWLEALLPSEAATALEAARTFLRAGDKAAAESSLRRLTGDREVGPEAALTLARLLLDEGRPGDAEPLLPQADRFDPDATDALRRRMRLAADASAYGGRAQAEAALAANPDDREARYALACALAVAGEWEPALKEFLELVPARKRERADDARLAMLAMFEQLGHDHPLTREYRRQLQIVT